MLSNRGVFTKKSRPRFSGFPIFCYFHSATAFLHVTVSYYFMCKTHKWTKGCRVKSDSWYKWIKIYSRFRIVSYFKY